MTRTMTKTKRLVLLGDSAFAEIAYEYFTHDSEYEVVAFAVEREYLRRGELDRTREAWRRFLEALAAQDPVYRDFLEKERRAAQRKREGHDVITLAAGEPRGRGRRIHAPRAHRHEHHVPRAVAEQPTCLALRYHRLAGR